MTNPSENENKAPEDQDAAEDAKSEAVPEKTENRNLGDELIAGMEEIRDNPEVLKTAGGTGAGPATVSDAIGDARPDEPEEGWLDTVIVYEDQDGNDIDGDAEVPTAKAVLTDAAALPRYKCHKTVLAFKIASMESLANGQIRLVGYNADHSRVVNASYVDNHHPKIGGYYVAYHDGYQSWSTANAFEGGYTLET